jgi:hypothetical protein
MVHVHYTFYTRLDKYVLIIYICTYHLKDAHKTEKVETKLTLKLDHEVINRAKKYARDRRTSLSKMIESFLESVTKPDPGEAGITPLVKSLSGVVSLPEDYDYRQDRTDYLASKHS